MAIDTMLTRTARPTYGTSAAGHPTTLPDSQGRGGRRAQALATCWHHLRRWLLATLYTLINLLQAPRARPAVAHRQPSRAASLEHADPTTIACLQRRIAHLEQQAASRTAELTAMIAHLEQQLTVSMQAEQQMRSQYAELQRLCSEDDLTGLYNRRHFFALGAHLVGAASDAGEPISAIMLDIDYFKQVNDTYGHLCGDAVLRSVATRCCASLPMPNILGRYGGEEFAVLLPGADAATASQVAEAVRQCVAGVAIPTAKGPVAVTISLGVATAVGPHLSLDRLVDQADQALLCAKRTGRNRVMVAAPPD